MGRDASTACTLARIDQDVHLFEYPQTEQLLPGFVRLPHHLREAKLRFSKVHGRQPRVQAGGYCGACWPLGPDTKEGMEHGGATKVHERVKAEPVKHPLWKAQRPEVLLEGAPGQVPVWGKGHSAGTRALR